MLQKKLVDGLSVSSPKEYDHVCKGCVLNKSHHLPVPKVSNSIYFKMELVVVNIMGSMSVETWIGWTYATVMMEASCQYRVGQLLIKKRGSCKDPKRYSCNTRKAVRPEIEENTIRQWNGVCQQGHWIILLLKWNLA